MSIALWPHTAAAAITAPCAESTGETHTFAVEWVSEGVGISEPNCSCYSLQPVLHLQVLWISWV